MIAVALAALGGYLLQFFPIFLILRLITQAALLPLSNPPSSCWAPSHCIEFIQKQGDEIRGSGYAEKEESRFWILLPARRSPKGTAGE